MSAHQNFNQFDGFGIGLTLGAIGLPMWLRGSRMSKASVKPQSAGSLPLRVSCAMTFHSALPDAIRGQCFDSWDRRIASRGPARGPR